MLKRIIFITIGLTIIVVLAIVGFGYFNKRSNETIRQSPSPLPTPPVVKVEQEMPVVPLQPKQETLITYPRLIDDELMPIDIDYPLLYVYDPNKSVIKYINLEDKSYKEIYKISNLKTAFFNDDKTLLVIENERGFKIINLKTDNIFNQPLVTKKVILKDKDVFLYINNERTVSYLALFDFRKVNKIRDLGILNPEFVILKNGFLIYESKSPLFFLDPKRPNAFKIFMEAKEELSALSNENRNLIFLTYKENNKWQSKIINLEKENIYEFDWGTTKEKCSFKRVLICAVPEKTKDFNPEDWINFKPSYDEKIIIYNPKNDYLKEIKLEAKLDIVKPELTPIGIIVWNRLDAKFYLIKHE